MAELEEMAGHLIRRLHQHSTQVFQKRMQEAGFDLTQVQFATLQALQANPASDQARIAELIAYDRATIGGVIDRLEQKGYVSRVVSRRDRRAREVSLTDAGQRTLEAALPLVRELQGDILSELGPRDRERFMALARQALGMA